MRVLAIGCALLTLIWTVLYIRVLDRSFSAYMVSLALQPLAWTAVILGYLGDSRAARYGRCGECSGPVPATARVCTRCGRQLSEIIVTDFNPALPLVGLALLVSVLLGFLLPSLSG